MADLQLMDVVQVLADEIGPRPTGTEEEQRAALTIQQWFTNEAGLPAAIEEVEGEPELDSARFFCYAVAFIVTLLAFIMKFLALPAIVFSLAAAVVVALESLGHPVLTRFLKKGISQNVVAVYEPETMPSAEDRRNGQKVRKIVLIARYDSQRLRADTNGGLARIAVLAQKIEFWALIATPVVLLIRYLFFYNNTGIINSIFSGVVAVLLVLMGLYLLKAIARRFAKYNDAANCNASGVAVLLDIAQRVNGSHVRKTRTRRHGARAAAAAAPEGATLDYETEATEAEDFDAAATVGAASRDDVYAVSDAINATETAAVSANPTEWRGRATNKDGYALAENVEVFSRGAAPAPRGTLGLGNNPDVVSTTRAVRVESGEQSYASTNPALASARAALQASRSIPADEHMQVLQGDASLPHSEKTHRPFSAAEMSTGLGVRDIQYTTRPRRGSAAAEGAEAAVPAATAAAPAAPAPAVTEVPSYAAIPASRYSAAAVAPTVGGNTSFADVLATVGYSERSADQHIDESVMDAVAAGEMTTQQAHDVLSVTAPAVVAAERDFQAANAPAPAPAPEPVAAAPAPAPAPAPEPAKPAAPAIPDWYARAKANSRRTQDVVVARSTFADALDQANESTALTAAVSAATSVAAPAAPAAAAPVSTAAAYAAAPAVTAEDLAAHEDFLVAQRAQAAVAAAASVAALEAVAAQQEALVQDAPAPQADPIQAATGFAAALAAAQEAEERKLADGTMTLSPASTGSFSVSLPEVATTMPQLTMADSAQRAPLAEAATSGQAAAKSLLTMLPSISLDNPEDTPAPATAAAAAPAAKSPLAGLASLPGFDDVPAAAPAASAAAPAAAPAPAPAPASAGYGLAGMTGTFASVSADLLQGPGSDDMFVDDADDSAFAQNFTAAGAFAGPSYMDMPSKKGLFGFGKKKRRQQEEAMAEAAAAAAAQAAAGFADDFDEFDDGYTGGYAPRGWNGGAFSLKNAFKRKKGQEEFDDFGDEGYAEDGYDEGYDPAYDQNDEYDFAPAYSQGFNQSYDGYGDGYGDAGYDQGYGYDAGYGYGYGTDAAADGGYGYGYGTDDFAYMPEAQNGVAQPVDSYDAYDADAADGTDDFAAAEAPAAQPQEKDLKQIFDFRDANISAEVWFVALGSESPNNSGMRAFLDAHGSELRNAIFVELEGMGAGDLCLTTAEGKYRKLNVSSRVRRMVQKAQEVMGIRVGECTYCIDNSATYHAMLRGMQSMHLVGSDGAKPALQNQANDVCANIDEGKLRRNADFVMELVRSF